jgi:hypothetical protein
MKGNIWNESRLYNDPVTLRKVRQITTKGIVNTIPSYHTGQAFSENGEEVIFVSIREGKSALYKAHLPTGDITCLIDPVEGIGGLNEIGRFGDGKGIPIGAVLAPKSRWAYYVVERQIRAVHIDTLEEEIIVGGIDDKYLIESIAVSPDEKNLVYVAHVLYPEKDGGQKYQIFIKSMTGGQPEVLFGEDGMSAGHIMYNPVDPDLLLYCRHRGPSSSHKVDEHSRTWIYKISEGRLIEVKTIEKQNFQTHNAWTWDGKGIVYHGIINDVGWNNYTTEGGWYIGLAGLDGNPIREYSFNDAKYYGHVSAMKGKNAAIIDGNILDGLLMWIYFDQEKPKIEIIAQHGTDFTTMPSQYAHPHAICDPSGRWIVYNSAPKIIFSGARSDIYSVEV